MNCWNTTTTTNKGQQRPIKLFRAIVGVFMLSIAFVAFMGQLSALSIAKEAAQNQGPGAPA